MPLGYSNERPTSSDDPLSKTNGAPQSVAGPVTFNGGLDAGGNPVTNVGAPTTDSDAATKFYVDALSAGLDWQESVLSIEITAPLAPVLGERHLIGVVVAPLDAFFGHDDEIAEWDGLAWDFQIPNPGWITYVEGLGVYYVWNGASWTDFFDSYLRRDGTNSMTGELQTGGNDINMGGGSSLYNVNGIEATTAQNLELTTLDNNKNVVVNPHGTGVLEPVKSQDMTGGSGFWFRPPSMTTVQANAMILAWGASDAGKQWYDTTTNQFMGWNGVSAVILG